LFAHGRWFTPGTAASSTTKTGLHDIAEILLKVALNTIKSINQTLVMIQIYKYMNDRDMRMINLYHRVCNQNNTTGVTSETGTVYPSGAPNFSPDFWWESFVLLDH
jgi:hypothetical protein